ncbi:hypothetical protein E4U23_008576 [Claviceps purpurea]|nr:hypothetical protein E4U23_008576 [Claviceps purpurea]
MLISEVTEEYTTNWEARNLGVKYLTSVTSNGPAAFIDCGISFGRTDRKITSFASRIFLPWRSTSPGVEVVEDITVKAAEIVDSLDDDADKHESTTQVAIPEMMTNQRLI